MTLKEKILEDMKRYMKEKNQICLDTVRMLKSDIKNAEIEAMKELDNEGIIKIVQTGIKKRKDSADIYIKAGRKELADKELEEVRALEAYLPKQLSAEELEKIIKETLDSMEEKAKNNFGMVMKSVMAKVSGKAEGKKVSEAIKEFLK